MKSIREIGNIHDHFGESWLFAKYEQVADSPTLMYMNIPVCIYSICICHRETHVHIHVHVPAVMVKRSSSRDREVTLAILMGFRSVKSSPPLYTYPFFLSRTLARRVISDGSGIRRVAEINRGTSRR